MKKLFVIITLSVSIANLCAQTPTANELYNKFNCTTYECIDRLLKSRGYTFSESDTFVFDKSVTFYYQANTATHIDSVGIDKYSTFGVTIDKLKKVKSLYLKTYLTADYNALMGAFKKMGLKDDMVESTVDKTVLEEHDYVFLKNNNISFSTSVRESNTDDGKNYKSYSFQVWF